MMKSKDFINQLKKALNSNTVYASGMWGQVITENIINTKAKQYPKLYSNSKINELKKLVGKEYYGFDCVCLVKSILWGWNKDKKSTNGGAKYGSNGVPDVGTEKIISLCKNVSTDFSKIVPGALLWMKGHVGVYIGNGQVIECTAAWTDNVLQSSLKNIGATGSRQRTWTKWGLLPYVDYSDQKVEKQEPVQPQSNTSFKNGDKVKLKKGATNVKGVKLASFVYDRIHELTNINNNEGIIKYNGTTVARVYLKDLILVSAGTASGSQSASNAPKPETAVTEGCKVKLKKGAKNVKGVQLASFVYDRVHIATNVTSTEAVIKYNGTVVARVFIKDLIVV